MFGSKFLNIFFYLLFIFLFCYLRTSFSLDKSKSPYVPLENIALDCGSFGSELSSYDGRNWTGDVRSKFVASAMADRNSSNSFIASSKDPYATHVPYITARIFRSNFTYTFKVTPGPKFVRLHFNPNISFPGLDFSKTLLSVTCGRHTLLRNFSALATANSLNYAYFFKEFIIHAENHTLELMFSPTSNAVDAIAFVNGIEVVSMPENLYIDRRELLRLVQYPDMVITLENTSALETLHRINMAGQDISPIQDTGMFRTWRSDVAYVFGSAFGMDQYDIGGSIKYTPTVPAYTAPESIYLTARSMGPYDNINLNYNLSWFFPVDTGFIYLVRLHFCDIWQTITLVNQIVFSIYINNQTAEESADIIGWNGGYQVPLYKDYVLIVPGEKKGIQDLWLELHPNMESKCQYTDAWLNGVEIFKIGNADGSLAGRNPPFSEFKSSAIPSSSKKSSSKKKVFAVGGGLLGGIIVLFLAVLLLAFCNSRKVRKQRILKQTGNPSLCRHFRIGEIKTATNNFDEVLIIGSGGFGQVYKGCINGGATTVAIKRGNGESIAQGMYQFEAEIMALSHLHHQNIVSLIGYCNQEHEMILVYEYMSNGTLFDLLHFTDPRPPLSWNQRLDICVGAARGLHYLHTGTRVPIIHRDVKTSNILVDDEWVAKVSDFGLSKAHQSMLPNPNTHLSVNVRGSVGYMDPEYFRSQKLTEKSDVYSFGVVLLEVISARLVENPTAENNGEGDEDQLSFAEWGLNCIRKREMDQLIDPHLSGKIKVASLAKFLEIAEKSLVECWVERPSMSEVVCSLELALQLQVVEQQVSKVFSGDDKYNNSDFSELMIPMGR